MVQSTSTNSPPKGSHCPRRTQNYMPHTPLLLPRLLLHNTQLEIHGTHGASGKPSSIAPHPSPSHSLTPSKGSHACSTRHPGIAHGSVEQLLDLRVVLQIH